MSVVSVAAVRLRLHPVAWLLIATLAAASMWFYVDRILIPYQKRDAAAHGHPRGNLSDLYPRWLGARELLLRGRNPYSAAITTEIQQGYYGRPLDPSDPNDPRDKQAFAYPIYVVFVLAPTVKLPFATAQAGFFWLLAALAALSVPCWFRTLQWKPPAWAQLVCMVLTLGSFPVVQGIKLQQLSLLVAGILAACAAGLAAGYLFFAGVLLALATIKPQLTWPLAAWLLLWAVSECRLRWKFVAGFAAAMAVFFAAGELILPGWLGMFLQGILEYHQYTQNQSVLGPLLGVSSARILECLAVAACVFCLWPARHYSPSSLNFGRNLGLVLALTVLIVPMYAPYNQILLLPAILSSIREAAGWGESSHVLRLARILAGLLLIWPWIATVGLMAASPFLTPQRPPSVWLPLYSNFAFPIVVFGISFLEVYRNRRKIASQRSIPAGRAQL